MVLNPMIYVAGFLKLREINLDHNSLRSWTNILKIFLYEDFIYVEIDRVNLPFINIVTTHYGNLSAFTCFESRITSTSFSIELIIS